MYAPSRIKKLTHLRFRERLLVAGAGALGVLSPSSSSSCVRGGLGLTDNVTTGGGGVGTQNGARTLVGLGQCSFIEASK